MRWMRLGAAMLFGKTVRKPQSYQPVLEATEVLDLFSRLTLHQQTALLRLISRNLILKVGEDVMGYDLNFEVEHAMIVATKDEELD